MQWCPGVVSRHERCAYRILNGRAGYYGEPQPKAIVLHLIQGMSPESFENQIASPLPTFEGTFGNNPRSVHFVVTDNAIIQYASLNNTTYGFDYLLRPTWPGLAALYPIENVNGPFIHVGLLTHQLNRTITDLLCCIQMENGVELPIIAASDIQCDRPQLTIDPTLLENVKLCILNGGLVTPPNMYDLEDRVEALEQCCLANTGAIDALQTDVKTLKRTVIKHGRRLDVLERKVGELFDIVAIIPLLQQQIEILIQQISRCCPPDTPTPSQACFHYQLLPGDEMVLTPNQPVHLNLPTKIEDIDPPIVLTGPLWRAQLLGTCNWSLSGIVRLRLAQWCAGKQFKLTLVVCGQMYPLGTWTAPNTGFNQASITFNDVPIPAGCDNVYLLASVNDDVAKIVEFAQFRGCGCLP